MGLCVEAVNAGQKRISRQSISEGSEFIRTKSKDNVSTVGQPPDRPGRVDRYCELIVNFYSLKTKKISAGRLP